MRPLGSRFVASELNTTKRPSAEMIGAALNALASDSSSATLTRSVRPVARLCRNTSWRRVVSPATRCRARDVNTTKRPSPEMTPPKAPKWAFCRPEEDTLTRSVVIAARAAAGTARAAATTPNTKKDRPIGDITNRRRLYATIATIATTREPRRQEAAARRDWEHGHVSRPAQRRPESGRCSGSASAYRRSPRQALPQCRSRPAPLVVRSLSSRCPNCCSAEPISGGAQRRHRPGPNRSAADRAPPLARQGVGIARWPLSADDHVTR